MQEKNDCFRSRLNEMYVYYFWHMNTKNGKEFVIHTQFRVNGFGRLSDFRVGKCTYSAITWKSLVNGLYMQDTGFSHVHRNNGLAMSASTVDKDRHFLDAAFQDAGFQGPLPTNETIDGFVRKALGETFLQELKGPLERLNEPSAWFYDSDEKGESLETDTD